MQVDELAPGLWSWTTRHPDWDPAYAWPAEVRCFYVEADDATLVIDPLVPEDDAERFWRALDADVERRRLPVAVLLTQAAHARSAGAVARRYEAEVWGHDYAREKVGDAGYHVVTAGDELPGPARVLAVDQEPGSSATPLYLPSHNAVAPGDVLISVDGRLRVWWAHGASSEAWYDHHLLPSLRRWLGLRIEHLLVAHGQQARSAGDELAAALERPPFGFDGDASGEP